MSDRYYIAVDDEADDDEGWGGVQAEVWMTGGAPDGRDLMVGWIGGGEPEDNTYFRDYSWVLPALNEAYQRGWRAGCKEGARVEAAWAQKADTERANRDAR